MTLWPWRRKPVTLPPPAQVAAPLPQTKPETKRMSLILPNIATVDPLQALGTALIGFLVGKDIESEATPTAQLAKAQAIAGLSGALMEVNSGQASGIADLQTAINNLVATVKDPAGALVLNELLATMSTQLAALESTVIGKLSGVTANLILTQINAVANYYVQQLTAAQAAAAAH